MRSALLADWARAHRRTTLKRGLRSGLRWLPLPLLLTFAALSAIRVQLPIDAQGWISVWALAITSTSLWVAFRLRRPSPTQSQDLEAFERASGCQGLLLAGLSGLDGTRASRFSSVLRTRLDQHPGARPKLLTSASPWPWPSILLLVAALGATFWSLTAAPSPSELSIQGILTPTSNAPTSKESSQSPSPQRPHLADLVAISVRTPRKIYLPNEFIDLHGRIEFRGSLGHALPLGVVLLVTDGTPSADVGYGPGQRPFALGVKVSLPAETPKAPQEFELALDRLLTQLEMNKPGLITVQALLVPKKESPDSPRGGSLSEPWTFRLAHNRSSQKVKKPGPAKPQSEGPSPTANENQPEPQDQAQQGGEEEPPLGDPEDLGEFSTTPESVEADSATDARTEKEVRVFNRERSDRAPPPPSRPRITRDPARMKRQAEATQRRLDLPPNERRLLSRYFEELSKPK